jgi:hypothetical protein
MDHDWDWNVGRCVNCDCRPFGRWANLPCGATEAPEGNPEQLVQAIVMISAVQAAMTKEPGS